MQQGQQQPRQAVQRRPAPGGMAPPPQGYAQPGPYGQAPMGPGGRPRKKKNNDLVVWIVSGVVTLVCVIGAIILISNHANRDRGGEEVKGPRDDVQAISMILNGEVDAPTIKSSSFGEFIDAATREAVVASKGLKAPEQNFKLFAPGDFDTYKKKIVKTRKKITDEHPTLGAMLVEINTLLKNVDSKELEVLEKTVIELTEFQAKRELIVRKARIDDKYLGEAVNEMLTQWKGKITQHTGTKTSREFGEAKLSVRRKGGEMAKRLERANALWSFFSTGEGNYADPEAFLADNPDSREEYDLIKDYYRTWSDQILTAFNADSDAWVKSVTEDANRTYQVDVKNWEDYKTELNARVTEWESKKGRMLEMVKGMVARAGRSDVEAIRKVITAEENRLEKYKKMRINE